MIIFSGRDGKMMAIEIMIIILSGKREKFYGGTIMKIQNRKYVVFALKF